MVGLVLLFVVATPAAALILTYLVFFEDGAKETGRWGVSREKVTIGASPYRAGESTKKIPQGAPFLLRFGCWLCAMAGVVTTAVFAPAGLILMFLVTDRGSTGLSAVPVFLVSMSGFVAGVILVRVARQITRAEGVNSAHFHYLYVHHACVVGTMLVVDAFAYGHFHLSGTCALICGAIIAPLMLVHSAAKAPDERGPGAERV
ncbi:MAG: hypothetical protein AB8H86_26870 [Polyangiales bacterium]